MSELCSRTLDDFVSRKTFLESDMPCISYRQKSNLLWPWLLQIFHTPDGKLNLEFKIWTDGYPPSAMPINSISPILECSNGSTKICKLYPGVFTEESWKNLIKTAIDNPQVNQFFPLDWRSLNKWDYWSTPSPSPSPSPSPF